MAIKKIKLPGMAQPVDIGTTWTNISGKPDLITSDEATAYMQKGVDYVTAGQNSESSLGLQATAEGYQTTASGDNSHAEGIYTTASGPASHAEGIGTIANHESQHVFGEYNIADGSATTNRGNYVEIVGNGSSNARSNARTLDWNGNEVLAGKLTVGAAPTENMDVTTKQYVDNILATNDAMVFKGTIGTNGTITALPATHEAGWTYKVITAGSFAGQICEIGDMIVCIKDGTVANANDWAIIQTNIDGAVVGPASSTAEHIATFTGTTGKVIKDSGFTIATSVPANAVFTDTTYENKAAASGGTDVSLVTIGDKYNWNNKYTKPSTGIPESDLAQAVKNKLTAADAALAAVPNAGSVSSAGVISIKHDSTELFTIQLPLYNGGVSNGT